jgi:hypothetical protein
MSDNVEAEVTADYKIFMIMNDTTKEYYISQTTNKYLSTTISDMKRRNSKLTEHIFIGDYTTTLLEVMRSNNLHFVKNRVNELIKIKKAELEDAKSIKKLDGRGKHTKEECNECDEETEEEEEDEEDSEEDSEEEDIKPKKKTTTKTKATEKKELPKYKCLCCDKDEYIKNKKRHEKTNKHIANELKYNKK